MRLLRLLKRGLVNQELKIDKRGRRRGNKKRGEQSRDRKEERVKEGEEKKQRRGRKEKRRKGEKETGIKPGTACRGQWRATWLRFGGKRGSVSPETTGG